MNAETRIRVAFLTPEMAPLAKTGGLADVTGALPRYLARNPQLEVVAIMPLHREVRKKNFPLKTAFEHLTIDWPGSEKVFSVQEFQSEGFRVYLIDNPRLFDRDYLYSTPEGDYPDNGERFAFFSLAALETLRALSWKPDIIHAHDWQSALAFAYLRHRPAADGFFADTRLLFTIHNLAYQGLFPADLLGRVGLPGISSTLKTWNFTARLIFLRLAFYTQMLSVRSAPPTAGKSRRPSSVAGWREFCARGRTVFSAF